MLACTAGEGCHPVGIHENFRLKAHDQKLEKCAVYLLTTEKKSTLLHNKEEIQNI
jgi:hypothetical protein